MTEKATVSDDWEKEAHRRLDRIYKYFKPKERQTIIDFIRTASDDYRDEKEGKNEKESIQK